MVISRRDMLTQVGSVAGAGATLAAMQMLGLTMASPASAAQFNLAPASGKGKSVVVLGAGIAGLVAAYELQKAGYLVKVLEARPWAGGRTWTIRGNDAVNHTKMPPQRAAFSDGLYFNAGAARIPSWHHAIVGYAKRLNVPLETFVNTSRSAGWDFNGKVVPGRRMIYDMNGRIGELLGKAIDSKALDAAMPKDELAAFRGFLGAFAGLDRTGKLRGQPSSGFAHLPGGYDHPGHPLEPLTLKELLPSRAIGLPYLFEAIIDMQPTMLQPVGGMDRIATALHREVQSVVQFNQPVTAIRREGQGVRIEHGGTATRADFCVCTIPVPVLSKIPNDFSAAKKAALTNLYYLPSAKVAFEAPRFWEEEGIYGGLAWTDRPNENVLYPSSGFHSNKGVLVGAYVAGWTNDKNPEAFVKLPMAEQIRLSRASVEALHPGKSVSLRSPLVVNWGDIAYSEGVGALGQDWGEEKRGARYDELLRPEGPIVFAGEHLSSLGLWQEGAALSAHEALKLVGTMSRERNTAA